MSEKAVAPRVIGTIRDKDGVGVVRMEDTYDTTAEDLWSALTDPARLARWIAEVKGVLAVGGAFHATFTSGWEGPGRVEECEPPHRLLLTMSPGEDEETVIEAELVADGTRTWMWIEERGIPVPELPGNGAGWQAHMEDLAAYLAGRERTDWRSRWTELIPAYRAQASDESA
jgi:uncharacterized protein YndB with AHSA1/START domain